jgi:S1-C subfamily serine protease
MAAAGGCPKSALQEMLGLTFSEAHGCVVGEVDPGSTAAKAGLKRGDSIVACNGNTVTCPSSLFPVLQPDPKTGKVTFTVNRPKSAGAPAATPGRPAAASPARSH